MTAFIHVSVFECGLMGSDHDLLSGILENDLWISDLPFKIGHDTNGLIWYHIGHLEHGRQILSENFVNMKSNLTNQKLI